MSIGKYKKNGKTFWKVDETLVLRDGRVRRFRTRCIPTREQAVALAAKVKAAAFEGRFFERPKTPTITVDGLWKLYESVSKREVRSHKDDVWRARHLNRHLGPRSVATLNQEDVDRYLDARLQEKTRRQQPPASATLDREVELLRRMANYAVKCGRLPSNPLAGVKLQHKPNARRMVIDDEMFGRLYEAAEPALRPILLVAFDTGMRLREILNLTWKQLDLREHTIRLEAADTKTEQPRVVVLTKRVVEALTGLPRHIRSEYVFANPKTGGPWRDIRKTFHRACRAAKLKGLWFHDLRRSFVTRARRLGIPESVCMRMTGHRTRSVFERYNIISEDDLRTAVGKLEAADDSSVANRAHPGQR
jgi:integrase